MNAATKKEFIRDLCESVCDDLVKKVERMPEEWDGHELRVLIGDKFEDSAKMSVIRKDGRSRRARKFRNEVIVSNL